MPLHTIPHAASTLPPAGFELNLNLTLYDDLYIREKREGETGRQRRGSIEADKQKQRNTETGRNLNHSSE